VRVGQQKPKLYLIGAGPGDPELLTLKAARVLQSCDVILYDRLVSSEVLSLARADAELIYVGKHEGEQEIKQEQIFASIERYARELKTVARLKGGDPLIFGRGAEEWSLALDHGMDVELIPGVTSAVAVPGLAGIPLTYRNLSQGFAVVTGHCGSDRAEEWRKYAQVDTLVVLMGVRNRRSIAKELIEAGRRPAEPIAVVESGTTQDERVTEATLGQLAAGEVPAGNPAILVIGEVVRVRRKLKTNEATPIRPDPGRLS
jgi:uroporphyrin-III C-methyltransferase